MGDMGDAFRAMRGVSKDRRNKFESSRMKFAMKTLEDIGYETTEVNHQSFTINVDGNTVRVFPYTGWFSGKGIKDGRGIQYLKKQLMEKE